MARETRTGILWLLPQGGYLWPWREPLLWNRKKGTGGERLEARYIRCFFSKSHVKRRRDRTIGGMGKWILGRFVCLRLKRGGKGDRDVEDSGERKGNQLRRITIEDGREGQREAGAGLWWVRDSSFTEEEEREMMAVDEDSGRTVGRNLMNSFLRTSMFLCELGGKINCRGLKW